MDRFVCLLWFDSTFSTIRHSNTFSIEILCLSVTFFKLNWEFL